MKRTPVSVVAIAIGLAFASGCGGGEKAAATSPQPVEGDPERGKNLYMNLGCGACHTYSAAGSKRNVGPNLDRAAEMYDAAFMRESLVDPKAFIEKGASGSIGGTEPYRTRMPAYGPDENPPQRLSEQDLADLVAFLTKPTK